MYSVYQHWDPLKVCIVGKSYPPEFYSFITNARVRNVMERIAQETEEDYQKLIKLLESFDVEILRPTILDDISCYWVGTRYIVPPMTPRDYSAMIGTELYFNSYSEISLDQWMLWRGSDWPQDPPTNLEDFNKLPAFIKEEIKNITGNAPFLYTWQAIKDYIQSKGNKVITGTGINSAMTTRIGQDLYFGTDDYSQDQVALSSKYQKMFPNYRCHVINTGGHSDSTFCPVVPGLIVSRVDIPTYKDTFPGWEVIYLPGQNWDKVQSFLNLKYKNQGKWWVPGEELNDEFTYFVEEWLNHWVGYVEETIFDVNMLVIDEKNVVCNNYNEKVFRAFERNGVTPHVINFRHRYFWDGGLHCITSDVHREGSMKDYFPERT